MEALYGIYKSMKERVEKILPTNQNTISVCRQDYNYSNSPFEWLYKFIFVIEKYMNSKVPHAKYKIVYSSFYSTENLHENSLKNLQKLKKLLQTGDASVNQSSSGFLPPSSTRYFNSGNFNVDFTNQFYRIKHFHLCSDDRKRDELLYYVIDGDHIYFLSIGKHRELYNQGNIEILVREFPNTATKMGIYKMPDMPIGEPFTYSADQLKRQWTSGNNSSFIIDGSYYTTLRLQTRSGLSIDTFFISNNIIYQFDTALNEFKAELGKEYRIVPLCFEDNSIMKNGVIMIRDEISKTAIGVRIPYLEKLEVVDGLLALK